MNRPIIRNAKTDRERELANALSHLIEWVQECYPGQDVRWHENVLADRIPPGFKCLAIESPEVEA